MFNKIIIWGHKLHTHTHSYIHSSYFKAFEYLGYETYWFDKEDLENLDEFDFSNSLFFTEDQAKHGMPLRNDCYYVLHHVHPYFIRNSDINNFINLANYTLDAEKFEKINEYTWLDAATKTLYQPWATDLLPNEIISLKPVLYNDNLDKLNYVGSIFENTIKKYLVPFVAEAAKFNKQFKHYIRKSDFENRELIRNSYLSYDFRDDSHIECGYIPCRVIKSLSYGKFIGTNSINVKNIFGDYVEYDENTSNLYYSLVNKYKQKTYKNIMEAMLYIKDKHTFVNRINEILKLF